MIIWVIPIAIHAPERRPIDLKKEKRNIREPSLANIEPVLSAHLSSPGKKNQEIGGPCT